MGTIRGHRMNYPSLMGAYLAINAIPDACVLVDGPDCALYKTHFIHGRHDLNSTLLDIDGMHRVCFTNVCAQSVTKDHNELIVRRLRTLNDTGDASIILLTSLPGCSITGLDYDHLVRSVMPLVKKEAFAIPPTSMMGDWLDGYAVAMKALAKHVDLKGGRPKKEKVGIVGYLWDRNEGDHKGNYAELKRLFRALGLELACMWFSGEPYARLKDIKDCGTIVSLPYGREAAAELARKTGARLVEAPLPFGMKATEEFVRQVASATGKTKQAEKLITGEHEYAIERLEWIVPYLFLHQEASFIGDPVLFRGFLDIAEDLGLQVQKCFFTAREGHVEIDKGRTGKSIVFEPDIYDRDVQDFLQKTPKLLITNTNEMCRIIRWQGVCMVELGFPSYFHHALTDQPFLGFRGFLSFVDRIADFLNMMRSMEMLDDDKDDGDEEDPDNAWGGLLRDRDDKKTEGAKRGG